jgi:hypothetical protein
VRRFISAIAFAAMLVVVLGAAGCGQRFDRDAASNAPAPADLAADALSALEVAGSAHFVADVKSKAPGGALGGPALALHFEGDASSNAIDAEGSISFGFGTLTGRILVGDHDLFIQFMDEWYGEHHGLVDAVAEARKEQDGKLWNELATPEGLRRNFDLLFAGEVSEGAPIDGVATWQFEGRINPEGIMTLAERFGEPTPPDEAEMIRKAAPGSRFVLVVGQEDHLPRRLELSLHVSSEGLGKTQANGYTNVVSGEDFTSTLLLSNFGKRVEIDPPADFKPLDELFSQLFSGFE